MEGASLGLAEMLEKVDPGRVLSEPGKDGTKVTSFGVRPGFEPEP